MKIACLLSTGRGHLDFGGMGYLRLAKELLKKHEVVFFTSSNQQERLENNGFKVVLCEKINNFWLKKESTDWRKLDKEYYLQIKLIELQIKKLNPDIILIDRILALTPMLAEAINKPYIVMGSPGGNWKRLENDLVSKGESIHNHNGFKEHLTNVLKWKVSELSAWASSPYMNIIFIPKVFYPMATNTTTFINTFTNKVATKSKKIAVSLGNFTSNHQKTADKIIELLNNSPTLNHIDLFAHKKDALTFLDTYFKDTSLQQRIHYKGYINFFDTDILHPYKKLLFAGGIGTLWLCLENNIDPIMICGGFNDQQYNITQYKKTPIKKEIPIDKTPFKKAILKIEKIALLHTN